MRALLAMIERGQVADGSGAGALEGGAPAHHQTFRCPVCGKDGDGENIPEMLEHHRHIINPAYYSYLRPANAVANQ